MTGYDRPYYRDTGSRPFLFYVMFGTGSGELEISRSRHRVEGLPEGLEMSALQRPDHSAYMDSLLGGSLGDVLRRQNAGLYERALESRNWTVLRGEVQNDQSLGYLRDAIGLVQAVVETGAAGVLDLQTLSLFSPADWTGRIFAQGLELPRSHVVILSSPEEEGGVWLHTRGMRKFGRPDISVEGVPEEDARRAAAAVNQMIFYGALGAVFSDRATLHIDESLTCEVRPQLAGDLDDPDFNNTHYQISWSECVLKPENSSQES